jgi:hypothetical protein
VALDFVNKRNENKKTSGFVEHVFTLARCTMIGSMTVIEKKNENKFTLKFEYKNFCDKNEKFLFTRSILFDTEHACDSSELNIYINYNITNS